MEQKANSFLETQPIGVLMRKYSVPCIISLLVAALYNIVDQIFIARLTRGMTIHFVKDQNSLKNNWSYATLQMLVTRCEGI